MTDAQTALVDGLFLLALIVFVLTWVHTQVVKWR